MSSILVIAPHPDDETLGCGGTLLRHINSGDEVHWLSMTAIQDIDNLSRERMETRTKEIERVSKAFGFKSYFNAGFPTTRLDSIPLIELIAAISRVNQTSAEIIYIPYRNDAHSDHAVVFDASVACCKSFRYPRVRSVYVYETLSETEFGLRTDDPGFKPNLFINIEQTLDHKISIMRMFEGELAPFPFPRSEECIRALAKLRGSQAGYMAAEAFMILKELR